MGAVKSSFILIICGDLASRSASWRSFYQLAFPHKSVPVAVATHAHPDKSASDLLVAGFVIELVTPEPLVVLQTPVQPVKPVADHPDFLRMSARLQHLHRPPAAHQAKQLLKKLLLNR